MVTYVNRLPAIINSKISVVKHINILFCLTQRSNHLERYIRQNKMFICLTTEIPWWSNSPLLKW